MKPTTQSVQNSINSEAIIENLNNLKSRFPDHTNNETTIEEIYSGFLEIKSAINQSIDKGYFENIAFNRRHSLLNVINNFIRYSNDINQVYNHYNSLLDNVQLMGLIEKYIGELNFKKEFKELESLRRRYRNIERDVSDSKLISKNLEEIQKKSESIYQNINKTQLRIIEFNKELDLDQVEIKKKIEQINLLQQEIENKNKKINAFHSQIEESEKTLKDIETSLKKSISKEISENSIKALELISEAETALELKQTEGISKAFSSRLNKLSTAKTNKFWLTGALIFVLVTLVLGYLIAGGNLRMGNFEINFTAVDNIGFIIGRITLTLIGLAGAIFCANRYVTLKNLEEDYEYKVVLSKSILAFSNKISEIDNDTLKTYLLKVLEELHQDPLRDRKKPKELNVDSISSIKELFNMWTDMNK